MGCCLSTKNPPSQTPDKCGENPPPIEEETVKEVLSETPVVKLAHSPTPNLLEEKSNRYQVPETQDLEVFHRSEEPTALIKAAEDGEVSEPSEQYSYSESLSTTTTGMEKKDDGEEVTQRPPVRVRRRRPNVVGDRGVRSPARRRHQLPPPVASSRATGPQWRNGGPPSSPRREPAGGSSRRSRSPAATRGQNVRHWSENSRPARASDDSADVSRPENCKTKKANRDDEDEDETGETIENPLVSLECFIFL